MSKFWTYFWIIRLLTISTPTTFGKVITGVIKFQINIEINQNAELSNSQNIQDLNQLCVDLFQSVWVSISIYDE